MTALSVPVAVGLDVAIGELPRRLHPVAWFGTLVEPLDREWTHPGLVGLAIAVVAPLAAAVIVGAVVGAVGSISITSGVVLGGVVLFVTTSWRRLLTRGRSVIDASGTDPVRARRELLALVGRDTEDLSPGQVRSAAVESVSENLSDGLVAPVAAFALVGALGGFPGPTGALALACGAATWVKAVNTLDSMIGYPDKPHGWGAARMDDLVMWVPARLTSILLALVATRPNVFREIRPWLADVASPNAGWPMATIAAIAGCRLEKPGAYVLNGTAALPDAGTARDAMSIVARAGLAAYVLATLVLAAGVLAWS